MTSQNAGSAVCSSRTNPWSLWSNPKRPERERTPRQFRKHTHESKMKNSRSIWTCGGGRSPESQKRSIVPNPYQNDFILEPRCGSKTPRTSDGPLRPSFSVASAKGPSPVDDGTRESTRNRRFKRPATIPSDESAPQTGRVTNDQNAHEHHNDQFVADQQRRRRSRRTKPESKKLD